MTVYEPKTDPHEAYDFARWWIEGYLQQAWTPDVLASLRREQIETVVRTLAELVQERTTPFSDGPIADATDIYVGECIEANNGLAVRSAVRADWKREGF